MPRQRSTKATDFAPPVETLTADATPDFPPGLLERQDPGLEPPDTAVPPATALAAPVADFAPAAGLAPPTAPTPSTAPSSAPPPRIAPPPPWSRLAGLPKAVKSHPLAATKLSERSFWIVALRVFAGVVLLGAFILGFAAFFTVSSAPASGAGVLASLTRVLGGSMAMILTWLIGALATTGLIVFANLAEDITRITTLLDRPPKPNPEQPNPA